MASGWHSVRFEINMQDAVRMPLFSTSPTMKRFFPLLLVTALSTAVLSAQQPATPGAEIITVKKIWDKGGHNAFTDLCRFKNLLVCAFREADGHVGGDGKIRVLISSTGETWLDQASVAEAGVDLRDPKLVAPTDDLLIMNMGGSIYNGGKELLGRQPRVATATDIKYWTPPIKTNSPGDWLWRATWHEGEKKFYGVSYNTHPTTGGPKEEAEWSLKLYSSLDCKVWQLAANLNVTGRPNEATVRFKPDGTAVMLVRREAGDRKGVIGTSAPPYRDWKWTPLSVPLGGPNFIVLPDGTMVAGSRGFGATPGAHMVLFKMTDTALEPVLELPSGGDCSYPGLVFHDGLLHVTYYSSHEGKSSIYYAKVRLPWIKK
jgi:hypothetical protein